MILTGTRRGSPSIYTASNLYLRMHPLTSLGSPEPNVIQNCKIASFLDHRSLYFIFPDFLIPSFVQRINYSEIQEALRRTSTKMALTTRTSNQSQQPPRSSHSLDLRRAVIRIPNVADTDPPSDEALQSSGYSYEDQ